jgi:GNAT superfamily N-acetyltransferase
MVESAISRYAITPARRQDLSRLAAIELAAARLLAGYAPESVLNETTPLADLERAQRRGHLWVASAADVAVGFAQVEVIEPGSVHLQELDVHPEHGRRGLGTRLVLGICDWAASRGYAAVTLTTFRDVLWNMPFYSQLGFSVVPDERLTAALLAVIADEARRGLDPSRRVVMTRPSSKAAGDE